MSDFAPLSEEALDLWLADQRYALVRDVAAAVDIEAGLREVMIPAQHADLVTDLGGVLDVEAGLRAIVSATPDTPFEAGDEPGWVDESTSSSGSVAVAIRRGASARVFVSHAKEDQELAGELYRRLVEDGHEVVLDQHARDDIAQGGEWEQWLHQRLQWADAMVCVVTSAYLASRRCTAEVGFARSRGSWLLPVRAEPGVDDPLLRSVTEIDLARGSVAAALVKTLRRVDDAGLLGWPKDRSPFPGLRPFGTDQHRVFFGRTDEVEQLATLLRSSAEQAEGAALLVVGPSGCGKSSLVRAGLLPVMANEPGWWTLPPIVPGADPVAALARELAAEAQRSGLGWTVEHVRRQLDEGRLGELADELLLVASGGLERHLLVVVDQFEELLTQAGPPRRARFAELLSSALTGPVRLVGTLRPEFLGQLLADTELAGLSTEIYPLRPLRGEALRTVIEGPARLAGIGVGERLVARLIDDTGSGEALPLLAFTLAQLADGVSRGGQLSPARYDQLGGLQGALTLHADTALADTIQASGLTKREVLAGLARLATVDETGRRTRRRIELTGLVEPLRVALQVFVDRHLLVSDVDVDGRVWLTVAHEALLTRWQPLDTATSDTIDALRTARTVEHAAAEWNSAGQPEHYLWDDKRLTATLATMRMADENGSRSSDASPIVELDPGAFAFLEATARRVHATKQRERRRRTCTVTVLAGLLVLTLIAAGIAVWQRQSAISAQRIAIARQLVAQAEVARDTDPRTALQLALAAQRIHPDQETRASVANLLTNTRYSGTLTGHTGPVLGVAFSPDGRTLATASADGTARLWNVATRQLIATLTGHTSVVSGVAFSPDGHTLATGSLDHTIRLWELADPAHPRPLSPPLTGHTDTVDAVAFSPDGRLLASASSDQTVRLWDVTDQAHPTALSVLTGNTNTVTAVEFSPDARILATGNFDHTVWLWDVTDRAHPIRLSVLTGHTKSINAVAFSPDGRILATVSSDQTVRLWDHTDSGHPNALAVLTGHTSTVNSVAFSPDGRILATTSSDQTVRLWDVSTHKPLATLAGHSGVVRSVGFAPDGKTLATASDNGTTVLWDLSSTNITEKDAVEHACSITGGGLNPDQWARYIPELPYKPTCP